MTWKVHWRPQQLEARGHWGLHSIVSESFAKFIESIRVFQDYVKTKLW